jgi:hypothetical protein
LKPVDRDRLPTAVKNVKRQPNVVGARKLMGGNSTRSAWGLVFPVENFTVGYQDFMEVLSRSDRTKNRKSTIFPIENSDTRYHRKSGEM